jgi:hypothetical protein
MPFGAFSLRSRRMLVVGYEGVLKGYSKVLKGGAFSMKSRRMLVVMKNSASPGRFPNAAAENGRSACVVLSTILRGTPRVLERQ